jgi:hypothetical protein
LILKSLGEDEGTVHSKIMSYDDGNENNMAKILHQVKMLKAFL